MLASWSAQPATLSSPRGGTPSDTCGARLPGRHKPSPSNSAQLVKHRLAGHGCRQIGGVEPVAEVPAGERGDRVGQRGRYGIDGGFAGLTVFGVIEAGLAGTVAWAVRHSRRAVAALAGVGGAAGSAVSYLCSTGPGKWAVWAQLLDELGLRGDEHLLDVGCGRGAVLMLAARRLPAGRAVGADVWRRRDQSGNSRAAAEGNAVAEGVRERVELADADARDLPVWVRVVRRGGQQPGAQQHPGSRRAGTGAARGGAGPAARRPAAHRR